MAASKIAPPSGRISLGAVSIRHEDPSSTVIAAGAISLSAALAPASFNIQNAIRLPAVTTLNAKHASLGGGVASFRAGSTNAALGKRVRRKS